MNRDVISVVGAVAFSIAFLLATAVQIANLVNSPAAVVER